jgi:predicted aldo/keto reductase-like oxidoreductase
MIDTRNMKLGFGFMRLPKVGGNFDIQIIKEMVDAFLAKGGVYFDTAYIYQNSEETLRISLAERYPRNAFRIATKLPVYMIDDSLSMQDIFQASLSRLGVDYIDTYLLHGIDKYWADVADEIGVWPFLHELRNVGKAKQIGFSFHGTPQELDYILRKHPEIDVVQLQINYIDWEDDKICSKELYETTRKHDKPIIVMEPVKGGLLAGSQSPVSEFLVNKNPEVSVASWAMRFAVQLEGVAIVLSGMNSMEQVHDNINTLTSGFPLNEQERATIDEAVNLLNDIPRIPCTACAYCVEHCPKQIKIPQFIDFLNESIVYNSTLKAQEMYELYTGDGFFASTCISCKRCERHCPQKLEIADIIAKVSTVFDKQKG